MYVPKIMQPRMRERLARLVLRLIVRPDQILISDDTVSGFQPLTAYAARVSRIVLNQRGNPAPRQQSRCPSRNADTLI